MNMAPRLKVIGPAVATRTPTPQLIGMMSLAVRLATAAKLGPTLRMVVATAPRAAEARMT